jgi:hypothetical protein
MRTPFLALDVRALRAKASPTPASTGCYEARIVELEAKIAALEARPAARTVEHQRDSAGKVLRSIVVDR